MAKRFTDTGKWKKEFIKGLPAKMKLLWFYILDDCDHAGIWEVDMEVASLRIGEPIKYDEALLALGQQIKVIGRNKWFIEDFIFFQYGELSPKNRMHQSVIAILNKYNIPLVSPLEGAKDMDKDKDKDKVKVEERPPFKITEESLGLIEAICSYFAVKQVTTSIIYNTINEYVSTIAHRNELQIASMALQNYMVYKQMSRETVHNVSSWIGTIENHFQDGQWTITDWAAKLKTLKANESTKTTSTASSAVIPAGKTFGKLRSY